MGPGADAQQEPKQEEKKDALDTLMKGEQRRAAARSHGDVWEEHRQPAGGASEDKDNSQTLKHIVAPEKEAADATGTTNAFDILMNEGNKREREEAEQEDPMEPKRAKTEAEPQEECNKVAEEKEEAHEEPAEQEKEGETEQAKGKAEKAVEANKDVEMKEAPKENGVAAETEGKKAEPAGEAKQGDEGKPAEVVKEKGMDSKPDDKAEPAKAAESAKPDEKAESAKPEEGEHGEDQEGGQEDHPGEVTEGQVKINRAPVLNLWVAVVAQSQGYTFEEGLTFGKVITGLYANSKGKRLGLVEEADEETKEKSKKARAGLEKFEVFGTRLSGKRTPDGIQAIQNRKPVSPKAVKAYLHRTLKDQLEATKTAMEKLAAAYDPKELSKEAYHLYEKFRPTVPPGVKGWGSKGILDLKYISDTLPSEHARAGA